MAISLSYITPSTRRQPYREGYTYAAEVYAKCFFVQGPFSVGPCQKPHRVRPAANESNARRRRARTWSEGVFEGAGLPADMRCLSFQGLVAGAMGAPLMGDANCVARPPRRQPSASHGSKGGGRVGDPTGGWAEWEGRMRGARKGGCAHGDVGATAERLVALAHAAEDVQRVAGNALHLRGRERRLGAVAPHEVDRLLLRLCTPATLRAQPSGVDSAAGAGVAVQDQLVGPGALTLS